jgi:hypothetical protein
MNNQQRTTEYVQLLSLGKHKKSEVYKSNISTSEAFKNEIWDHTLKIKEGKFQHVTRIYDCLKCASVSEDTPFSCCCSMRLMMLFH